MSYARLRGLYLLLPLFLTACDSQTDGVSLRVHNASATDFATVSVSFPTEGTEYSDVEAGGTSDYRSFETAYRYAAIEISASGETFRLQPFDFFEEPLEPGRYTYVLGIEDGQVLLSIERD